MSAVQPIPFALSFLQALPTHAKPFVTSQSALVEQREAQAPLLHRYPEAQATGAGATQLPLPSQVPAPRLERRSAEHAAAPQVSPWWVWQPAPLARQMALLPQALSTQAPAQQMLPTPPLPTQLPLPHSEAREQLCPFFLKQAPPKQP